MRLGDTRLWWLRGRAAPKTTRVAARAASRATHHPGKEASSQSRTLWIKTRTAVVRKLNQGDPEGATPLVLLLDLAPRQVYRGGANAQMAYSPFPAVVSSWQRANLFRQARSQDCTARPLEEDLTHHEV